MGFRPGTEVTVDNALELLVIGGGYSLAHAMMMLIPEAWSDPLMDPERRAFELHGDEGRPAPCTPDPCGAVLGCRHDPRAVRRKARRINRIAMPDQFGDGSLRAYDQLDYKPAVNWIFTIMYDLWGGSARNPTSQWGPFRALINL